MKNILLIITLFISWNAIAGEKTWYCATEKRAGLNYKLGTWEVAGFTPLRMVVKQQNNTLSFSNDIYSKAHNCNLQYSEIITCGGDMVTFSFNTNTGLATSSNGSGWAVSQMVTDNAHDTAAVSVWKCESF
jgi:hypothetical protein